LFEYDTRHSLLGFADDGRYIFRQIAHILRSYHLSDYYCGNVVENVHINAKSLTVSFAYLPVFASSEDRLIAGIKSETMQFRHLVADTIHDKLVNADNELVGKPLDFELFFSEIYVKGLKDEDINVVKEISFFQLFHPLFFDSRDRTNFVHLVVEWRNRNKDEFDSKLSLHQKCYELCDWTKNCPPSSPFFWMVDILRKSSTRKESLSRIPILIRNVHEHFNENDEVLICYLKPFVRIS